MSHQEKRKVLIQKIVNTYIDADKAEKYINQDELIAIMGAEEGVSRRTALEYIKCAAVILEKMDADADIRKDEVEDMAKEVGE